MISHCVKPFKLKTVMKSLIIFVFVIIFIEMYNYSQFYSIFNYSKSSEDYDELINNDYAIIEVPGDFLNQYQPIQDKNRSSYCNFNYGLPNRFVYSLNDILPSPELDLNSSYRVLYNVINSTDTFDSQQIPQVTYCTHATPEFLFHFSEIVRFWDGPISLTVFVPGDDVHLAITHLKLLCDCLPQMFKVSVHFIFPVNLLPIAPQLIPNNNSTVQQIQTTTECLVPVNYSKIQTYRNKNFLEYPVNIARNVARIGAKTKFLLVSDVELIPSEGLATKFMDLMKRIQFKKFNDAKSSTNYPDVNILRYVFVVPVFEVELSDKVPRTKLTLQQMYANNRAVYFHRWICLHCQRFPGLQKWLAKTSNSDIIKPLVVVKREFPYHRWEPIYIGTNEDPLYSEALSWEGLQDKMTQMLEMCFLKYRFVILDNAFLVHMPGIKRRATSLDAWRRPYQRRNAQIYTKILKRLAAKYEKNHRCRLQ